MTTRVPLPPDTKQKLGRWYSGELMDSTPIIRGSIAGWLFARFRRSAVVINKTVHLTPRASALDSPGGISLLGHEYYHVVQQRDMGWWRFLALYVWRWRPSHISNGRKHPLEAPAYQRGEEIARALRSPGPD